MIGFLGFGDADVINRLLICKSNYKSYNYRLKLFQMISHLIHTQNSNIFVTKTTIGMKKLNKSSYFSERQFIEDP